MSQAEIPDPILEVVHVSKSYGGVQAVKECTFGVARGSVTGLIGPNGAGKSTLINLASGFVKPDSGTIRFDGADIQGKPMHQVSRLGLMRTFQSPREWPGLTVMENMLLASPPRGRDALWRAYLQPGKLRQAEDVDRVRARELLRDFNLYDLRDELAGNLSGGQKRLLEFARIAFAQPQMVLLDEPQSGVNPVLADRMIEAILRLNADGITVLLIEHNLPFVERLCPRVVVMALGTSIAAGSMDELRADADVLDAYLGQVPVSV
ncbi:MAG TPA: ABC transporter ATP-binding protein [Chloroflexota bacterium]|jgi:branched-chain amino acid transport system ATP-binding protein|nr:ABC transporter ATP-binding protein [Chloroflexota bacterium]